MKRGLNNNQLKLLAMLTMTADHVGLLLFPEQLWLRLVGRLAFPVYAYMIAEGCRHTRSMGRYLCSLLVMAVVCQLAYFFAMGSLYQCIMVTFSLSVILIWVLKWGQKRGFFGRLLGIGAILAVLFLTEILPLLLPKTDYEVDYGFIGVMLPVALFLCKSKTQRLWVGAIMLGLLASYSWIGQWAALLSIPLLALYNGRRGKRGMKWIFYLYYPAHLLLLQGISWVIL